MKILIANDQDFAMKYYREAFGKALVASGHEVVMWDIRKKNVYDSFDQFDPDMVFLQGYNLTNSMVRCVEERPNMKVVMRVSDYSDFNDSIIEEYPVIKAGEAEINFLKEIQTFQNPLLLHTHHCEEYLDLTHKKWIDNGFNIYAFENFGDLFDYTNGEKQKNLECDLSIISGYWRYKAQNYDKYILPLCNPNKNYNIRIFGNQRWPGSKYCGFAPQEMTKHMLKSSKICLNMHEPHSNKFGYDCNFRGYCLLLNKCFMISDYVEGFSTRFPEATLCKTPEEYWEKIDYFLSNSKKRDEHIETLYQRVLNNHTAFERLIDIFNLLDLPTEDLTKGKQLVIEKKQL